MKYNSIGIHMQSLILYNINILKHHVQVMLQLKISLLVTHSSIFSLKVGQQDSQGRREQINMLQVYHPFFSLCGTSVQTVMHCQAIRHPIVTCHPRISLDNGQVFKDYVFKHLFLHSCQLINYINDYPRHFTHHSRSNCDELNMVSAFNEHRLWKWL